MTNTVSPFEIARSAYRERGSLVGAQNQCLRIARYPGPLSGDYYEAWEILENARRHWQEGLGIEPICFGYALRESREEK